MSLHSGIYFWWTFNRWNSCSWNFSLWLFKPSAAKRQTDQVTLWVLLDEEYQELDQVYCTWLSKWVVKRERIQQAQLCASRLCDVGSDMGWYLMAPMPVQLQLLKKVEIWSGLTSPMCYSLTHSLTHRQQNIGLLSLSKIYAESHNLRGPVTNHFVDFICV